MFNDFLTGNEFFEGGIILMLVGAVIAGIRYIPQFVWHIVQRLWTVSVTTRDQTLVSWLSYWLAESKYAKDCQWLDATTIHLSDKLNAVLRPGFGIHTFKHEGVRFWLEHLLEDQGIAGKISVINIRTIGRNLVPLRKIIDDAVDAANRQCIGKNVIYVNDRWGNWGVVRLLERRSGESLFLSRGLFEEILDDATTFFGGVEWYRDRGLPYRRGHLLFGPAGNGKSTIIQVLATELKLPIYFLTLSHPEMTDYDLAMALGRLPEKCLLVIEDFEKVKLEKTEMTMGGLLNVVDGPLASEGRLLVFTANKIENIDDYFLRPGRIDRQWVIDIPDVEAIEACFNCFGVDGSVDKTAFLQEAKAMKWSMAQVQKELHLKHGPRPVPRPHLRK
ncbi:MAG: AAA family ATPase [Dehalococcoidia bacterium]|nr:MAG: AAA family ATPase [Dehalococcoidia bacterium]